MINLVLLLAIAQANGPIPEGLISSVGFSVKQVDPKTAILPSKINSHAARACIEARKPNNEALKVKAAWISETVKGRVLPFAFDSTEFRRMTFYESSVPPSAELLPSGAPGGEVRLYGGRRSHRPTGTIRVCCDTPWAMVQVSWHSAITRSDQGRVEIVNHDESAMEALVEKIIRHTLINAAGLRSEAAGSGSMAGQNVGRVRRKGSTFVLGDLPDWTSRSGWTITEEDKFGLLHLKKGSKWAVLPLGADQIKINGVWKEVGDSAAFKGGKLYLPEAGLKHLKDGG